MKSQKLSVSRATMWRRARHDLLQSVVSDLAEQNDDLLDTTLAVEPMDDDFANDMPQNIDSSDEDDFTDPVNEGVECNLDFVEYDNIVGWRWLNSDSESDESEQEDSCEPDDGLRQELAEWSVANGETHTAVGLLLLILKKYHPSLPKDPRTLLKTPTCQPVTAITGGEYCHIGLLKGLSNILGVVPVSVDHLDIQINIDGLPLFKSSSMSLWPILCSVRNIPYREPFVVGAFCGNEKPGNPAEFLSKFVAEAVSLMCNGVYFGNKTYSVDIHSFVCDAPARAFCKGIKSHSGYSSCEKCTVHGEYEGKVIFTSVDAPLRTDDSFITMIDEDHHNEPCPLSPLPIGFVTKFGLDYMHMACLGVMRRLLLYWKGPTGPLHVRLDRKAICEISKRLVYLASYVPVEFARKPRSMDDLLRWKATELREFMLYLGPVVLAGVLPSQLYDHYMLLCVALRILASPKLALPYNDYANRLLRKFVLDTELLYGKETLVYNVHCLIHMAADVKQLGCLDEFSAFAFENKLGQLKKLIRKPSQPLQQLMKRLDEQHCFGSNQFTMTSETMKVSHEHNNGPVLSQVRNVRQYRKLKTSHYSLCLDDANCCILMSDGLPARVKNIIKTEDNISLICARLKTVLDAFSYPLRSTRLSICKIEGEHKGHIVIPIRDVIDKVVCLPVLSDQHFIIMPFVHSFC